MGLALQNNGCGMRLAKWEGHCQKNLRDDGTFMSRERFITITVNLLGTPQLDYLLKLLTQVPLDKDNPIEVLIRERVSTRNSLQNAKMWKILGEISDQVDWYGCKLTPENWKDVFTAGLKKQKVVPGMDGGFVVCGTSTRKMTIAEMAELIELITAFGVTHDVKFSARGDDNEK